MTQLTNTQNNNVRPLSITADEIVCMCVRLEQLENMAFINFIISCSKVLVHDLDSDEEDEEHSRLAIEGPTATVNNPQARSAKAVFFPGCSCGDERSYDLEELEGFYDYSGRMSTWL